MTISSIVAGVVALLLPTKSVDVIVSVLSKVAERLAAAEASQNAKATGLVDRAKQLQIEADAHLEAAAAGLNEADRAARVRANVAKLIA